MPRAYIVLLGALAGLGPFTIDLYLPAFPTVAADFGVTPRDVQLTLTATSFGFALGQLLSGPLSDRVGRRRPVLIATSIHIAASLVVVAAGSIEVVTAARVLQGMSSACAAVVAYAIARDIFRSDALVKTFGGLTFVQSLAPVIAPILGAALLGVVPWRGLFVVLAVYGALILVATALLLRESLPQEKRVTGWTAFGRDCRLLLTDRVFVGLLAVGAMQFSVLLGYLVSAPFLLQTEHGLSPWGFALCFALVAVCITAGTRLTALLSRWIRPPLLIGCAQVVTVAAGVTLIAVDGGSVTAAVACFAVTGLAHGVTLPCIPALALSRTTSSAGTAASLLGFANFGVASAVVLVFTAGAIDQARTGAVQVCVTLVGAAVLWVLVRPTRMLPPTRT